MKKIYLVTGCAGFIGFHVTKKLLEQDFYVLGIDNLNNYYSTKLKKKRLDILREFTKFNFSKVDMSNFTKLNNVLKKQKFDYIFHFAAQAGVRHSLKKPKDYLDSNIIGYFNLLEIIKLKKIKHLILASTSSIYGESKKKIFQESDKSDFPIQFYAATKKTNEVISYSYSHIYNLPITATRFFTVYGPYGRPDMAYYSFTEKILDNKKIEVFNYGNQMRDFTYIDDVVEAVLKIIFKPPSKKINFYRVLNIGKGKPDKLFDFIKYLEKYLNKEAKINFIKAQLGDVNYTRASLKKIKDLINYKPKINLDSGIEKFTKWYLKKN
jgi:UDP-glucuronate 4-epimerase